MWTCMWRAGNSKKLKNKRKLPSENE
uniref:Uncharacterized protein n=1 Tax=Rhizophora mucronata TaxID=61149 RepID=A0A2P2QAE7_RHIMU